MGTLGARRTSIILLAVALVTPALAFFFGWMLLVQRWNPAMTSAELGDAMGPAAGLATSLALAAAVVSVIMQSSELAAQRRQLESQLDELELSRAVMKEQAESQRKLSAAQDAANKLVERQLQLSYLAARISVMEQWHATFGSQWSVARHVTLGCVDRTSGNFNVDPAIHYENLSKRGLLDVDANARPTTAVDLIELEFNLAREAGWHLAPEDPAVEAADEHRFG